MAWWIGIVFTCPRVLSIGQWMEDIKLANIRYIDRKSLSFTAIFERELIYIVFYFVKRKSTPDRAARLSYAGPSGIDDQWQSFPRKYHLTQETQLRWNRHKSPKICLNTIACTRTGTK